MLSVGRGFNDKRVYALLCLQLFLLACELKQPPGATLSKQAQLALGNAEPHAQKSHTDKSSELGQVGTISDSLPFEPTGEKLASIAWRTWIYTDVGPQRTRLGYLRAGAVVDARGPRIENPGCKGGWLRINPRGFVCLGKGATVDLDHPIVRQYATGPRRGEGFPYVYAKSRSRPPERYFRLPSGRQMQDIEGKSVLQRAANWRVRAERQGLLERLGIAEGPPDFLGPDDVLEKAYGVRAPLRRHLHSGRASAESGFALMSTFFWAGRGFGLSSEMDILALDRLELVDEPSPFGLVINQEPPPEIAFFVKGATTLWRKNEEGDMVVDSELRSQRGFVLTGKKESGGLVETQEGLWLARSSLRTLAPRTSFPSIATGRRKWIDVSIKNQLLVAYEGKRPVYATLISAGRGGLAKKGDSNPEGNRTVAGTYMIHQKELSSTMDGDDERADSFDLRDVPHVQYFHRGFALHGAYWHDDFGKKRSHGCINLAPTDSAWLFEWTDPPVPQGWHAALNKKRGTVVHIRY